MVHGDVVWGALLAAGALYELDTMANGRAGDTLSERTRWWFRTHTRPGRAAFAAAWLVFAGWFLIHILAG